jgi:hypothetical protein
VTGSVPSPRPHRPARYADITPLIDAAGGMYAGSRAEIAAATAAALLQYGREEAPTPPDTADEARFVHLAEQVGIDTLAELWRDADPVSLPGALFALYLLRQWCHGHGDEVARLWRAGAPYAPADAVVAGVADAADPGALRDVSDAVLRGIYRGDLDVALERAAALFRVFAVGRDELAAASDDSAARQLADRNRRAATDLASAAHRWREGTLH